MAPPAIEMRSVEKSFGANHVLRGVNLAVERGESLAIIGGSGTGKSVAIKCIIGLVKLDAGTVLLDGNDVTRTKGGFDSANFGMLFQGGALFDSMPIWQNVAFRLLRGRISKSSAMQVALEKLARVGLSEEVAHLYPSELSGGMQKRAGLARAIATDPEIIFFDEPTTGLDPIMSCVINELIRGIVDEMGATAITITHDMASVKSIAHKVVMLHQGVVEWSGKVDIAQQQRQSDSGAIRQWIAGGTDNFGCACNFRRTRTPAENLGAYPKRESDLNSAAGGLAVFSCDSR